MLGNGSTTHATRCEYQIMFNLADMYRLLKSSRLSALACIILLPGFLCIGNMVKGTTLVCASDTGQQLKLNVLTMASKKAYTLTITTGKLVKAKCDPPQTIYNLTAILKNNSNDTLKYIDWTTSSSIWRFDKNNIFVKPSDLSPCFDQVIDHDFIMYYTILPHQSAKVELSIIFRDEVSIPFNKTFKIGVILQRVIKKKDFEYYHTYFLKHELSDQIINLIWSNTISMTK
jgi:hypothetical protein